MSNNQEIAKLSGPMLKPRAGKIKNLVILLHGYGSDGNDLISLGHYWRNILPNTIFIAPNAPQKCDINPMGYQWFALDTSSLDVTANLERLKGAKKARPVIEQFLNDVWSETGLSANDTILVGFSQGAMMALEVGLRLDEQLKGIIAFSGGLPDAKTIAKEIKSPPPICFVHGENDEIVPPQMSKITNEELQKLGLETKLHISPNIGHSIAQDGLDFAGEFIKSLT